MRRISFAALLAAGSLLIALAPAAGQAGQNSVLFPKKSRPYGVDIATWGERATQWIYRQPLGRSPLFDDTGANCAVDQHGPVWFIARIAGPPVFSGTRSCTIPAHRALFLYIGADVEDYPCPAFPGVEPAPGQSLYDFLSGIAKSVMDTVDSLEVSLDGRPIEDVFSYRYGSDDLFELTGDPSLQPVLDPCITGSPQQAVIDGFFMLFKPLERGEHTIAVHGTNTFGHDKTFTYHLTIE
jgi:hypothetical protein